MNYSHKLFIIFSLVIIIILWYSNEKLRKYNGSIHFKYNSKIKENFKNASCNNNDPLFLAMKNSAEISILKSQVAEITKLKDQVKTLDTQVKNNTTYIQQLQQEDLDTGKNIEKQLSADFS